MGRTRRAERRRRLVGIVLVFLAVLLVAAAAAPLAGAGPYPVNIAVDATNGTGRSVSPGRPCDEGGAGAYWHYEYGTDVPSGVFGNLPAEVLVHLDLHSDLDRYPNVNDPYTGAPNPRAYLQGVESHASLLNDRGSVKVRLASGDCDDPSLTFDGSDAAGAGTWEVVSGSGAYEDIVGSGTFALNRAEVNPGADNALDLDLAGQFVLDEPNLEVEVIGSFWGGLGVDYLSRRVTVAYRITNTGPGDSYGTTITAVTNPTAGVTPLIQVPIELGDLSAGESRDISMRHQLQLLQPCALIILNCHFQTSFTVSMPDALDLPHSFSATVNAKAPNLPPPL